MLCGGWIVNAEYLGNIGSGQDGAIFDDYLFRFDGQGHCSVYSIEELSSHSGFIAQFTLDKTDIIVPHSNSVAFSNTYYDENDEFPLLYSNVYNNYAGSDQKRKGVTCVYRIERNNNTFSSTLVQVIEIGFTEDSIWKSESCEDVRPYGNFAIDTEKSLYYAFTMRDEDGSTRYFSFDLPDVNSGDYDETLGVNHVILEKTDIINQFDCEYHRYVQGACFENGVIYSLEGFTNDKNNPPAIRLIDANTQIQKQVYYLSDFGLTVEPEFIDFTTDGVCYYSDFYGDLYKLIF